MIASLVGPPRDRVGLIAPLVGPPKDHVALIAPLVSPPRDAVGLIAPLVSPLKDHVAPIAPLGGPPKDHVGLHPGPVTSTRSAVGSDYVCRRGVSAAQRGTDAALRLVRPDALADAHQRKALPFA